MDPLTSSGVVASLVFGVGGLIVGVVGLQSARRANALSRQANKIAETANATADRSVAQVEAADARALESHVVEWAMGWDSRHLFWVRNDGRDTARAAFIRVTIDGVVETVSQKVDITPGEAVRLQFDTVLAAWDAEDAARDRPAPVEQYEDFVIVPGGFGPKKHILRVQIWWRTDLGSPQDFERAYAQKFVVTDP